MAHIVVTGASSGVGKALATKLSNSGEDVIAICRRNPQLEKSQWIQCDLSNIEETIRAANQLSQISQISAIYHCAGVMPTSAINDIDLGESINTFKVNTIAPLYLTSKIIRPLAKSKGLVVCISSIASSIHISGEAVYSASKAAVDKISQSMAIDLGRFKIKVLNIAPGIIKTEMTEGLTEEQYSQIQKRQIVNGDIDLEEFAEFLSELRSFNKFVTGTTIHYAGVKN